MEIAFYIMYVVVTLFSSRKLTYEFSVPKYAIITTFLTFMSLMVLMKTLKREKLTIKFNLAHAAFFSFAISALISTVNVYRYNPVYFRYSFDIAIYVLLTFFTSIFISNFFDSKDRIKRFLTVSVALAGFVAFDALLNFYGGIDIFLGRIGNPFSRASVKATIGNVNFVSNYLSLNLPLALYLIASTKFKKKEASVVKVIASVSALLTISGILVGQTRSLYVANIISLGIFLTFYQVFRRKKATEKVDKEVSEMSRTLTIFVMIAASILIVLYNIPTPLNGYGRVSPAERIQAVAQVSSWHERLLSWLSSVYQWKEHRILGTGIGTYQLFTINYMGDVMEDHPTLIYGWNNFKRTHNDYLQVLGEMGIVGFASIIFLALSLGALFFKILKKVTTRDDLLLFLALSSSFLTFMMHSAFSFPAHLLPNGFLAMAVSSAAVGVYFYRGMEKEIRRPLVVLLGSIVLLVGGASTYLKWNYFISEVYFKQGNAAYLSIRKVEEDISKLNSYERQLKDALEELNSLTGRYSYLKPNEFKRFVMKQNLPVKPSDLELEKLRLETIQKEKQKLQDTLQKVLSYRKQLLDQRVKLYRKAKEYFLKSVETNKAYGRSYFYLAVLAASEFRVNELKNLLKTKEDYEKFFGQDLDEYQRVILPDAKKTDLEFLKNQSLSTLNTFGTDNLLTAQALLDSVSLYLSSLKSFNERNTYKGLATRYVGLHQIMKVLLNNSQNDLMKKAFAERTSEYFDKFVKYVKITIHNLPGAWNRFPDWKHYDLRKAVAGQDIYRYFATKAAEAQPLTVQKNREFLFYLAEKEIWAVENMNRVGVWGVPDGVFDFLHAMPFEYITLKNQQEALFAFEEVLKLYEESYRRTKESLSRYEKEAEKRVENTLNSLKEYLANDFGEEYSSRFEELFKGLFEDFKYLNWLSINVQEMNKLITEKNYTYKLNPWRDLLLKRLNDFEDYMKQRNLESSKINEVLSKIYNDLIDLKEVLVFERYVRFLAHYRLLLNDAEHFLKSLENAYNTAIDEQWKIILEDWSVNLLSDEKFETKDQVLQRLKKFEEFLENLENTI
ncbi:O-antigen ligase family protein [Thermotoga sp.]|uniref:O-antigen ligase family protein n=1 Tax=Thermotoga sp. TaxID=28240 RepID=UPI0025E21A91|nr:O-antigen ligase family protein [Thermotoga sp.]MCD6552130.1 O-antigen ligase family protein [Thermotoga sp.]